MIRNYLLSAVRNFQRQKLFAVLNMFGLSLGLASAILIFLYVSDEMQYDVMHPYYDNTYRIGIVWTNADGQRFENTTSPGYLLKRIRETRTEVVTGTRVDYIGYPTSLHHKASDKIILSEQIKWVEPNFYEVIDFHLSRGNQEKLFEDYYTMVMSETGARKMFGDADPIGQVISVKHRWATNDQEIDVVVTGVYHDFPSNSHFKPEYMVNVNAFRKVITQFDSYMEGSQFGNNMPVEFFENYMVLKPGADVAAVQKDLEKIGKDMMTSSNNNDGWQLSVFLAKLSDLHFDQKNLWEQDNTQGNKAYLMIFSLVAISILLIACINYMNLATARSARRAKEVGLRKSLGSKRLEIAKQFFYESGVMTMGSLFLALILVVVFLQPFNQLAHKTFTLYSLLNPYMIGIVLAIVIFMAFLSGSYPAIYLSGFRPVEVLKGQLVKGVGADLFRKGLVTAQYTVSLVLIIGTFVIIRQMEFMQSTKLNEQGDQLLSIRYGGIAPQEKFQAFKQAVLQDPDIQHVTMANHLPRLNFFGWIGARVRFPEYQDKEVEWNQLNVDWDFAKTYKLELVAGRDFDPANPADSSAVIINEACIKALNQPQEKVLGSSLEERFWNNAAQQEQTRPLKVIGIVKDFPFRSMNQAIEPLMINPRVHNIDRIAYVQIPAGKFQEKIKSIEKTWREIFPTSGFDYWFVSDEFNRMYITERRVSSLAKAFAILAVVITALGVFGLASYTAEQKTKEVGIRKVMGASVSQVVSMFTWIFLKIFLVATVLSIPVAYFLADNWLKGFVYRSPLSPLVFGASLMGLLIITLVTVSYETWKAARTNPVNSLRSE